MASLNSGKYKVHSATLRGVEAVSVDVEISVFKGLPSFSIVGMVDSSIQESRDRIYAAIKSSEFSMPGSRIVVNLAPGFIKKSGSGFDLPIAIGVLAATGQIPKDKIDEYLIVGELSLAGDVRAVPGILAYALRAKKMGLKLLCANCADQTVEIEELTQCYVSTLRDFRTCNFKDIVYKSMQLKDSSNLDYKDIVGHEIAKRALEIAACGNHGVLMVGPPGSGKTMLANRMPSILPALQEKQKMEAAVIHSIAGEDVSSILNGERPFRTPHHSASLPGLIGGGKPTRPGEVSLAHHGVLYLDELAEFSAHVLQGVRQPMESGNVTIIRADGAVTFPAKFSLIASTNPCPCGYYGDKDHSCRCSAKQISNYQKKIGGPVLDRIDMHIDVSRIKAKSVLSTGSGRSSNDMLNNVIKGIDFRKWRLDQSINTNYNDGKNIQKGDMEKLVLSCNLSSLDMQFFEDLATKNNMSGRAIMRVLSVSRTIADMSESLNVLHDHICEALTFRINETANYGF